MVVVFFKCKANNRSGVAKIKNKVKNINYIAAVALTKAKAKPRKYINNDKKDKIYKI